MSDLHGATGFVLNIANGNTTITHSTGRFTSNVPRTFSADTIRLTTAKTPATATATETQGDIAWDADYVYVCTATNTWKRSAIATW